MSSAHPLVSPKSVLKRKLVSIAGEESNSDAFFKSADVFKSSLSKGEVLTGGRFKLGISSLFNRCNNSTVATDPLVVVPLELKKVILRNISSFLDPD